MDMEYGDLTLLVRLLVFLESASERNRVFMVKTHQLERVFMAKIYQLDME